VCSHFAEQNNFQLQHFLRASRLAAAIVADSIALQLRNLLLAGSKCSISQRFAPCLLRDAPAKYAIRRSRLKQHGMPAESIVIANRARIVPAGMQWSRR
jgi:hypothetical protein